MFSRIHNWINERWPLSPLIRLALEEEMKGGSSYAYIFGSSALIIFLLQAVTGVWQLFYYVPTLAQGYNSLNYLRTEVPFGWLIHGLHYWGASAMIVLVILHLSQVFIWGAYKQPHELQWVTGVFLFLLTMGMSLTGGALPWDKRSYWLVEVAASAAGSIPVAGDLIKRTMLGGGLIGQLALSRFFILHVAILSGALLALIAVHLVALRKVGNAGPWSEIKQAMKGSFWPDQVFKDAVAASMIIVLLIALSVFFPPPYAGMADPLDASYVPKPEWNFLFFYEALKYFPGRLEVIATAGIPLIGTLILLLIPFVDSAQERSPHHRPLAMAGWIIAMVLFIILTLAGAYSNAEEIGDRKNTASLTVKAALPTPAANALAGSRLVQSQGCLACHRIGQIGGMVGPDLSAEGLKGRSREWLSDQLQNPKAHNPSSVMPPVTLNKEMLEQVIDYLLSLKGTSVTSVAPSATSSVSSVSGPRSEQGLAANIIGSADHGAILFEKNCLSCHGHKGTGKVANPGSQKGMVPPLNPIARDKFSTDPKKFVQKIDPYIQHGSRPEGQNPTFSMIAFGDENTLTQQQIADIEAYVLSLNGVDRAMIYHPGISPDIFFIGTVFAFSLIGLNLCGWWWFGGISRREKKEVDE